MTYSPRRLVKASIRSNDLLTRLLKTSNRLNDLLTRSLEHPSVQTTWVWDSHTSGLSFLFAYSRGLDDVSYGKKALRSLEQSASRLRHNHKISPNSVAREETVHVEKSNYSVVSLGSKGFCFWMPIQKYCSCVICERRQLSFKAHSKPLRE